MTARPLVLALAVWLALAHASSGGAQARGIHLPLVRREGAPPRVQKRDAGAGSIGVGDFVDV